MKIRILKTNRKVPESRYFKEIGKIYSIKHGGYISKDVGNKTKFIVDTGTTKENPLTSIHLHSNGTSHLSNEIIWVQDIDKYRVSKFEAPKPNFLHKLLNWRKRK